MKPEHPPVLTGKYAKQFVEKVEAAPSKKNIEVFREAERVHKAIKEIK